MSLNVYIEEDFEHDHEARQAADLCRRLSSLIPADACYTLLLNFYLNGKQLDAVLVTPHKFVVIDFKYVRGPLKNLDANRPWRCVDGYELEGSGYGNPFKQVTQYRRHLGQVLMNYRRDIFVNGSFSAVGVGFDFVVAMGMVSGAICLGPDIDGREPTSEQCDFPNWFFFGRPKVFADKCLTLCQGQPVRLDENIHRAFVSCNAGLRKAIIGQDGIPKLPRPVRLRQTSDGAVVPAKAADLVVTEDTTVDEVLVAIAADIDAGTRCFVISGAAGTGKTALISRLIPVLEERGLTPALMAPTGRAAKMMTQRTGRHANTIHSSIYKRPDLPQVDKDGDAVSFVFQLRTECPPSTAFIVDESSMVQLSVQNRELLRFGSGSLLKDLIEFSAVRHDECSNVLIFIGDHCQLNPVCEKCKVPPALDRDVLKELVGVEPKTLELKKIYRQVEDSGILDEAFRIRAGLIYGRYDRFHYRAHSDVVICPEEGALEKFCPQQELDEKIIIAQTNDSVWNYNNLIRQMLRRDTLALVEGERLMSLRNTHVPIGEDGYEELFMNGDFLYVDAIPDEKPVVLRGFHRVKDSDRVLVFDFTFLKMTVSWPYERDRAQVTVWVNVSPIVSQAWRDCPEYASMALYNAVRRQFTGLSAKELEEKLRNSVLLRAPIVTYGYAITGHKSQGGEWNYVWVDYHYAQNRQTDDYFRWAYTVTTRAKKCLYAISPPSFDQLSEVLKFDDADNDTVRNDTVRMPLSRILVEGGYVARQPVNRPYAFRVFVRKSSDDEQSAFASQYVDVIFNGKNLVTSVGIHVTDMPDELKTMIRGIIGMTVRAAMEGCQEGVATAPVAPRQSRGVQLAHEYHAGRIREAAEKSGFTVTLAESLNEYQLRVSVEHPRGTGYFDIWFDGKGRVSKLGTYTLPISVLKEIQRNL